MVRQSFQPFPGEVGKARGQQHHEQQNPSPQLRFLALQILWRTRTSSAAGRVLSHGGSQLVLRSGNDKTVNLSSHRNYTDKMEQPSLLENLVRRGDFGRLFAIIDLPR